MRKRSAMLESLETLRQVYAEITVSQIVALLYLGDEGEPLPLPDLRRRAGMSSDAAWKTVTALTEIEVAPGEPLAEMKPWSMRGIVAAELAPAGRALCAALDEIIREAHPIVLDPAPADRRRSGT